VQKPGQKPEKDTPFKAGNLFIIEKEVARPTTTGRGRKTGRRKIKRELGGESLRPPVRGKLHRQNVLTGQETRAGGTRPPSLEPAGEVE